MTDDHIVSSYSKDLKHLQRLVIEIKDLVCRQVPDAVRH